jgi:[ribosomal protein S5]-alanine N-acetyltransferase
MKRFLKRLTKDSINNPPNHPMQDCIKASIIMKSHCKKMNYLLDGQQSHRLRFRKIKESDFKDWLPFYKDPKTTLHWIAERESAEIECRKWYDKQLDRYTHNEGGMNALVCKENGNLIGHCGLLLQVVDGIGELEIGYSILPVYWNKGFAFEAAEKCRDFAFQNNFCPSLISIVSPSNIASEKVARKIGMNLEKQTDYHGNIVNIFRLHIIPIAQK